MAGKPLTMKIETRKEYTLLLLLLIISIICSGMYAKRLNTRTREEIIKAKQEVYDQIVSEMVEEVDSAFEEAGLVPEKNKKTVRSVVRQLFQSTNYQKEEQKNSRNNEAKSK